MRARGQEVCYKAEEAAWRAVVLLSRGLGGERGLAGERLDNCLDQSTREEAEQDRARGGDQ